MSRAWTGGARGVSRPNLLGSFQELCLSCIPQAEMDPGLSGKPWMPTLPCQAPWVSGDQAVQWEEDRQGPLHLGVVRPGSVLGSVPAQRAGGLSPSSPLGGLRRRGPWEGQTPSPSTSWVTF